LLFMRYYKFFSVKVEIKMSFGMDGVH
jgi:hypothetical protein